MKNHTTLVGLTDRSPPIRFSAYTADPANVELVSQQKPHPQAEEIIKDIDTNQITNKQVRRFLNLKNEGYNVMDTLDEDVSSRPILENTRFRQGYT